MPNRKDRVILDTNLWISLLLTKNFAKFDKIIDTSEVVLVFSDELMNELIEVSQRKKFQKYFALEDIDKLLILIQNKADFIKVKSSVVLCRDSKDNFLLSLAIDGRASHLITGDKDLLIIEEYERTTILSMADYLKSK